MYNYQNLRALELEISSYCNAACPQCPRNNHGGPVIDDLPLINWSLNDLQSILEPSLVRQLNFIYFCGTYGDPMFNKSIVDMCSWLKNINTNLKLGIHTNGSLGRVETYQELAKLVDFVAFGIDGLEDTNHLYRKNTNWNTIVSNAKTFVDSGGIAYWDFIVFAHNEHQVDLAREFSHKIGFQEFNVKKTARFFNKEHKLIKDLDVLDSKLRKTYKIELPTNQTYLNKNYSSFKEVHLPEYVKNTKISCISKSAKQIYIGADGYVFPCGWLHDRLYGIESARTEDRARIYELMEQTGGTHSANCFKTPLVDIVDGPWFTAIQDSWNSNKFERCAIMCGDKINLIKEQNESIYYK